MIDWLAEQYVASGIRSFIFLHNPTFCRWIDALQLLSAAIAVGVAARLSYGVSVGWRFLRARKTAEVASSDDSVARRALRHARNALARARGNRRFPVPHAPLVLPGTLPWLCTVGVLRPRVCLTDAAVRVLDPGELRAALAHELVHVARRDNLRRGLAETGCFFAPVALWWWYSLHLVVSSPLQFGTVLCLGLASGLLLRALVIPVVTYWQERRADEWAAEAVGDRLLVASALVRIGSALGGARPRPLPALLSAFAPFGQRVACRVRRLMDGDGRGFARVDLALHRALRFVGAALVLMMGLAVHRAETRALASSLQVSLCSSPLSVRIESAPDAQPARVSAVGAERLRFEVP